MTDPGPSPILLAIETSQREGSVALRDRAGSVHEEHLREPSRHDDDLMPAIDRLFKGSGLTPGDLKGGAVGVSIGPGGFTGLRIAISTAKMLGEMLGSALVAVPTALVAAESYEGGGGPISVALASKHDTAWITRVQRGDIIGVPGIHDAASLDLTNIEALLADEAHLPATMREACDRAGVPIIPLRLSAAACLRVAERLLAAGAVTDPLHLSPLYPREPEAVTIWRRKHGT